jgi:hypothetical protein
MRTRLGEDAGGFDSSTTISMESTMMADSSRIDF